MTVHLAVPQGGNSTMVVVEAKALLVVAVVAVANHPPTVPEEVTVAA